MVSHAVRSAKNRCFPRAVLAWALLFSSGCVKSPENSIDELLKTNQPTFGGQTERMFTTPSTRFTLKGECDPLSYKIEYSYNEISWTEISGACPKGSFSIPVFVEAEIIVYVRARAKFIYTPTSVATVRLALPPSSPHFKLTNSGRSDSESVANGGQNEMGVISAETLRNSFNVIKTSLVDVLYDESN